MEFISSPNQVIGICWPINMQLFGPCGAWKINERRDNKRFVNEPTGSSTNRWRIMKRLTLFSKARKAQVFVYLRRLATVLKFDRRWDSDILLCWEIKWASELNFRKMIGWANTGPNKFDIRATLNVRPPTWPARFKGGRVNIEWGRGAKHESSRRRSEHEAGWNS